MKKKKYPIYDVYDVYIRVGGVKMLDINFNTIVDMIEKRKNNAVRKVNKKLILLYLDIGKYLYSLIEKSAYGDKITTKVAEFMKNNYLNLKGFTRRNLYRMLEFYKTYKDDEKVPSLVTQLSWTNNLLILNGTHTKEARHFYLHLCIKENYSKRELERQLKSSYYERTMLSNNYVSLENEQKNSKMKMLYSLEFLNLPNKYTEYDFKKAILNHMKDFILEIGKDYTFIEEYKVHIGNKIFILIYCFIIVLYLA